MENVSGTLSILMFVTMPNGHLKRVTLASIHCEYAERETVFRKFINDNGTHLLRDSGCVAEFVMREPVFLSL